MPIQVGQGQEFMIHRHGFLCATPQVTIGVGFQQSLGAGIFGGNGFLLQKVAGQGTAWLELSGELIMKNLAPGEVLRVHPGHVGAFQASVGFQITMVPGIKNMIFGGDGIFLAVLQGPGTVWLQTLPISRLAHQIGEYLPRGESAPGRPAPPAERCSAASSDRFWAGTSKQDSSSSGAPDQELFRQGAAGPSPAMTNPRNATVFAATLSSPSRWAWLAPWHGWCATC